MENQNQVTNSQTSKAEENIYTVLEIEAQIKAFGENAKKRLSESNITQKKIAKEMHISNSKLSKMLSGSQLPTLDVIIVLLSYLNCKFEDLIELNVEDDEDISKNAEKNIDGKTEEVKKIKKEIKQIKTSTDSFLSDWSDLWGHHKQHALNAIEEQLISYLKKEYWKLF